MLSSLISHLSMQLFFQTRSREITIARVPQEPAEISVSDDDPSEESFDLETEEDDAIPIGSGFVFEDEFLNKLMNDRFGQKRIETEAIKRELVGTSVKEGEFGN